MGINRKQMKADARLAMREHKPSIYLITLVFLLVTTVLEVLSVKLTLPGLSFRELLTVYSMEELPDWALQLSMHRSGFSRILELALSFMSAVLALGFTGVCLSVSRRLEAGYSSLLDAFGFFFKALWLNIVTAFFITLWSLLLVIPGIVAAYRYSMARYVLLDDPGRSVMDCIRESKRLTAGHKGELFILDLSFLGWIILSAIPFVSLFTLPYMEVTRANYYNVLSGYQPETPQLPEFPDSDSWWS